MRLDDFRKSSNVEDRRGSRGRAGTAGGIGIFGLLAVLAISWFTGINPATLIGGYEAITGGSGGQVQQQGQTGTPNDATGEFVAKVLGETEVAWTSIFRDQVGQPYRMPQLVLFTGGTVSACGSASSAMGPFYCPNDSKVYLDTSFFQEMRQRFNACPPGASTCEFAFAYVIAHEVGHHVQNVLGILPRVQQAKQRMSERDANQMSVRTELQADCLAGVWANQTQQRLAFLEKGDIEAALTTASAIGDDMLQRRAQGYVVPDSFTHGTADQRQRWFVTGLRSGQIDSCDTFNASSL